MTAQPTTALARPATRTTRSGARGRALLAALGLALAAAILPAPPSTPRPRRPASTTS